MNRHSKFYAEVAADLEEEDYYDEDSYDYEEEAEYEEEQVEGAAPVLPAPVSTASGVAGPDSQWTAARTGGPNSPLPALEHYQDNHQHQPTNPHTAIAPDIDADYDVLDVVLPRLHDAWKVRAPTFLPLTESEAVTALRAGNYAVDSAVRELTVKREAERAKRGGGGGVLKVSTTSKKSLAVASLMPAVKVTGGADHEETHRNSREDSFLSGVHPDSGRNTVASSRYGKGISQRRTKDMLEMEPDAAKPDCTFVIAGHVDAGKSTTLGHLLLLLGRVSSDEVERNEKAGRAQHKESFKYAWLLDQSEEERRRGVTIDSGSFCFETEHRRVHILDAPGHKDFVISMISSATQADAALLVVTASTSDFETGLQHGTKSHLLVLKTLGVGSIVVAVNKMDTVGYAQDRYDYVVRELQLLLKQTRIPAEAVVGFCPISGMTGANMTTLDTVATPWYHGPSLLEMLDSCPLESRLVGGPLRLSLQDVQGTTLYVKVESGKLFVGDTLCFVPCDVEVAVKSIQKPTVGGAVQVAFAGETVEINTNSSLTGLYPGCVGCDPSAPVRSSTTFEAQLQTFRTLTKSILPGSSFTAVVHALTVTLHVVTLISKMDRSSGSWSTGMVKCVPPNTQALVRFRAAMPVALEPAAECRALGRFVLQQDGETVAGGLVTRVVDQV